MSQSKPPRNFVPTPFEYRQIIEVDIVDLSNLGVGVGKIDGWVVMVPNALAGERVKASVYKNHKNYSEADLVEVLTFSPERVEPKCSLFEKCGGCQYQHLSYDAQLRWKNKQVSDLMKRIGGIDFEVAPTHPSPVRYAYRSKLTPHYERPRGGEMPIGFIMRGRRNALVDVPQCPIAVDAINADLPQARAELLARSSKLRRGGTLLLRACNEGVCRDNNAIVSETVGGITYRFCAGEFFQNNPFVLPELVDFAMQHAKGNRNLVDAYCGVGMFALAGAKHFENVAGVEISAKAIECANANAKINRIENCDFMIGKAEAIFADVSARFVGSETSMIIDPPRAGCDEAFLRQLVDFAPSKLVYVSCAPDTQARDLAYLTRNGYALEVLQPFDLFPQTRHIENVAVLKRA